MWEFVSGTFLDNSDLASFFSEWAPIQIKQFLINNERIYNSMINSRFYIDSLADVVSKTTKEINIKGFYFKRVDLQKFVIAAHNVEQLIFDRCSIRCLKPLNFDKDIKYNIKNLSFQSCGNTEDNILKTHWIKISHSFYTIIDAISKCGLKDSLTKINLYKNQTLSVLDVQKMLKGKGITHIAVVKE